mgnify:CR=1 FL=1
MTHHVYQSFVQAKKLNEKKFAVLIDPDEIKTDNIDRIIHLANSAAVDCFLGSFTTPFTFFLGNTTSMISPKDFF